MHTYTHLQSTILKKDNGSIISFYAAEVGSAIQCMAAHAIGSHSFPGLHTGRTRSCVPALQVSFTLSLDPFLGKIEVKRLVGPSNLAQR